MVHAGRRRVEKVHDKDEREPIRIPPYRELIFIDPLMNQRDEVPQHWHWQD